MSELRVAMGLLWLLMTLLNVCPSRSLNLDEQSPTIVQSGVTGVEGVGFGWAIAQHRISSDSDVLLISAPRGNGSFSFQEGVIYECPFDVNERCRENLNFGQTNATYVIPVTEARVNLEGQLLGYSLRSFGDRVVATAPYHRQSVTNGVDNLDGRIVSLNRSLDSASFDTYYNTPFFLQNVRVLGIDTGFLQGGTSEGTMLAYSFFSSISSTAPGTLFRIDFRPPGMSPPSLNLADGPEPSGVDESIQTYSGYHVETGQFTTPSSSSETQIAMSSPRGAGHLGYVDIIDQDLTRPGIRIMGDELDGYFGYDVAVVNFGQPEGYQSLVIGCPLCRTDRGRVYVYLHTGNPSSPFNGTASQVINSPSSSRGRFGIGVEAIGDIDRDGFEDVAVSAPYLNDGVIYIYRGSESGLVIALYQTITPQYPATAFGYSMSGGLDIDGNDYPDLTVADLSSGSVTTIRGSPLVNVSTSLQGARELDILGGSSRVCPDGDNMLHCFNVTPCFYYTTQQSEVSRFALKYNLSADLALDRVGVYEDGRVTTLNSVVSSRTITGSGEGNSVCGDTVTFALFEILRDPADILVSIMVEDADEPIALEEDPALARFGKPLHPKLRIYESGDVLARTQFDYPIVPNINCAVTDPSRCEGVLNVASSLNLTGSAVADGNKVILARENVFTLDVAVTNSGDETSVGSAFVVQVPDQIVLADTNKLCNFRTENGTLIECPLQEIIATGDSTSLSISFTFNDTLPFLGMDSFNISLFARDGGTSNISPIRELLVALDTLGEYRLSTAVAQAQFSSNRAVRSSVDTSAIPLSRIGPDIPYTVLVQNSIIGTAFPRSTLTMYLPTEMKKANEEGYTPLLIPASVTIPLQDVDRVNCSHYQSVSGILAGIQQPNFTAWMGPPPPSNPECEREGMFRCGAIICTIFNLQPLPEPPTLISVIFRLYSPAVDSVTEVSLYATVSTDTVLPRLSPNSLNESMAQFLVRPGPRDVARECIRYWVVVVSVVIGIFVLLVLIIILAMCGVFRRWYKSHQRDMMGDEQTDYEFQRRTVPPISTNGTAPADGSQGHADSGRHSGTDKEREKEAEAAAEMEEMFPQGHSDERSKRKSTTSAASITFDPSKGLEYDGGEETDI